MIAEMIFYGALVFLLVMAFTDGRFIRYKGNVPAPAMEEKNIVIRGSRTGISAPDIHLILLRHHGYYRSLHPTSQQRFLNRLKAFMDDKYFIIMDEKGYREMPVLASAAAIQIGFGLIDYRFPFYKYIRIFPREYWSDHSFTLLAGNVQQNVITIAWNQLLHGFENQTDGSNVGLHEMSHALYIQKIIIDKRFANSFSKHYACVMEECSEAARQEKEGSKDLYTSYADKSLQEFWAESVELFFEKPHALHGHYPDVFDALKSALNQDPRITENPVIRKPSLFYFPR
jgi:MtfA peptidase